MRGRVAAPQGRLAQRGHADIVGLALTWLGGGIAALLLIPVLGLVGLASSMAGGGASDDPGLFVCRSQVCVDEMTAWTFAGLGVAAVIVTAIALAVWSRTWSLLAATAISTVALIAVTRFALYVWDHQPYTEVMVGLVVVALAPGALALGSILRLWARRVA